MITRSKKIKEQRIIKRTLFTNKALDTHGITICSREDNSTNNSKSGQIENLDHDFHRSWIVIDCQSKISLNML